MLFYLFRQIVRFPRSTVFSFPKLLSTKTKITAESSLTFKQKDVKLMNVNFHPAASFEDVIPTLKDPGFFCLFLS